MRANSPFTGLLKRDVTARIPTDAGEFRIHLYECGDKKEHIALVMGDVAGKSDVLVRIHSECFTGEVLGSRRCDCGEQLRRAMESISGEGQGVIVYLRQEGRGIGLSDKLRAYNLQDQGYDTVDANIMLGHQADGRDYTVAALILKDLQVSSVRLLTNNPRKIEHLQGMGIAIAGRMPIEPTVNDDNAKYLLTKALRMNHLFQLNKLLWRSRGKAIPLGMVPESRSSLYFTGVRQVSVNEETLPRVEEGQVLVRSLLSAISPGTEALIYRGEFPDDMPLDENISSLGGGFRYPLKYGYSLIGQVIAAGEKASPEWVGRHVMAFNPHESHFAADPGTLMPLPGDLSPEDAVFLPNMETAVNFVMDGSPLIGEKVAVFGQGIVGLLTTALLARFPLARLVTLDRHPLRRQASKDAGAHACIDPGGDVRQIIREQLPGGADLTYEVSGSPAALDEAILATGYAGRIVVGSWYGSKRSSLSLGGSFHRSRIRMVSSQVSTVAPEYQGRWTKARRFDVAWEMIRRLKPSRFITHSFPIKQAAEAYRLIDQSPGDVIQVILTY